MSRRSCAPLAQTLLSRQGTGPEHGSTILRSRVEFAYVDDAAHFITDDVPAAVADLALDWLERAA
jgi:hypothetical protein